MQEGYITLREASEKLGYRNHSTLRNAARLGRLRTVRVGVQLFTTQEWLDVWRGQVRPGNYKRGLPKGQDARPNAGEDAL